MDPGAFYETNILMRLSVLKPLFDPAHSNQNEFIYVPIVCFVENLVVTVGFFFVHCCWFVCFNYGVKKKITIDFFFLGEKWWKFCVEKGCGNREKGKYYMAWLEELDECSTFVEYCQCLCFCQSVISVTDSQQIIEQTKKPAPTLAIEKFHFSSQGKIKNTEHTKKRSTELPLSGI